MTTQQLYKIVWTDNLARETINDKLVAENIRSEEEAKTMLDALQAKCTTSGEAWYKLQKQEEPIYTWKP